jgi:hypothetical protein
LLDRLFISREVDCVMNSHHRASRRAWLIATLLIVWASACASDARERPAQSLTAGTGPGAGSGGSAGNSDLGSPDAASAGVSGSDCRDCAAPDAAATGDGGTVRVPRTHLACDDTLALDSTDPNDGARAIGLCPGASSMDTGTGLVSAAYTDAVGDANQAPEPLQIGLVDRFGTLAPREGSHMLLLSTGVARAPDQPGYTPGCDGFSGVAASLPAGFPTPSPRCAAANPLPPLLPPVMAENIFEPAALSLELTVPAGAVAFSVDFNFYTSEFPAFVCASFNDFFVILVEPAPAGASHGNVAFDANANAISVNNSLLRVCDPAAQVDPRLGFACDLGTGPLTGTGFDQGDCLSFGAGGATGWLTTQVPVSAGAALRVRFAIWDAGDTGFDSSVLIDNFRFVGDDLVEVPPSQPTTKPVGPD